MGNAWSDSTCPGYADATNEVYAEVFRQIWPTSHIARNTKANIGDHIESLLGWYIYWRTEMHADFDELLHLVVEQLNLALLSTWILRYFYY